MLHVQTDESQAVPGLGMVPASSLTTYVCGAERATNRDPVPVNHVCEGSIVGRRCSDRVRSAAVMYVSDESVMATVTAVRTPAYGLDDLAVAAEGCYPLPSSSSSVAKSRGKCPQLRYRYRGGNRVPGKTGEKNRAVNRWAPCLIREPESHCCPVGKQAGRQ